jgi:hypothetical protein
MQIAFDLDFADPRTGSAVPWAEASWALLTAIAEAPWKIVDTETTELSPASLPLTFTPRELQRRIDPRPRLRVVSVLYPDSSAQKYSIASFDLDRLSAEAGGKVCDAVLTGVLIAHSAGFDIGWLRSLSTNFPRRVIDSMLVARVLYPQQPIELAKLANDEEGMPDLRQAAIESFEQGRSGWSLADLVLTVLGRLMSKELQGPRNWCEPFLTQANYDYATDDVKAVYELLLNFWHAGRGADLVRVYDIRVASDPVLQALEPQVLDVARMRDRGMPWCVEEADRYVDAQRKLVAEEAAKLIELEPTLLAHRASLVDFAAGVRDTLRHALGAAFRERGLVIETTQETDVPKIGEKDLRRAKAAITPSSKPLFTAWSTLCRAKRAGQMANEFSGYAKRSNDGRIHSNIGHGPATGRLSSSDPNVQQAPRDQGFRNAVQAPPGHKIIAVDFSALDMRVGAALAIRAQRQILEAHLGKRNVATDVRTVITRAFESPIKLDEVLQQERKAQHALEAWKARREGVAEDPAARKHYWKRWRTLARNYLLARFERCLVYVRQRASQAGTPEWGSLRDAFSIPGMDIHTWTALSMQGEDPLALFAGRSDQEVVAELKAQKKRLGDVRQSGKVANLSLTYLMQAAGFQDAAARVHNIHWTLTEATEVRVKWLASYVEVDLWHAWTELNPIGSVYVPDPDRGNRFTRKDVFASVTLADRLIYAFGANAALAYQDQSTGADILADVMDTLQNKHRAVAACIVNQVHDELVTQVPDQRVEEYATILSSVMVSSAEKLLGPYGVRVECSPAVGQVWIKD